MKPPANPPRLAAWLLTTRLSEEWRDFIVGDLEEEFRTLTSDSPLAARTWFWWQTIRCLARPPRSRRHPTQFASSPGDSRMRPMPLDLKFAFRTLFRTPFVTVIAVVSLALGIGATAAIFSVFHQVLLQSVAVPNASELVNLNEEGPKPGYQSCDVEGTCDVVFSYPMFRDLQKVQTVFTGIAAHVAFGANLAYQGQTSSSQGLLVSGSYFPVLELKPALGRLLTSDDDKLVDQSRVVVLSYDYWAARFGLEPDVVNKQMIVNGQSLTIVGVAPKGFRGTTIGLRPDVYVPITLRAVLGGDDDWANRTDYWAYLFARLRPGVTIDGARAALGTQYHTIINTVEAPFVKDISEQTRARFRAKALLLEPGGLGRSLLPCQAQAPLRLLLAVTGFVLLIACANIANLLLARSTKRAGEMALRLSIGASRMRLVGQLLTESLLLAVLGGFAGLIVARWTLVLVTALLPPELQHAMTFGINGAAVLFASAVTIGTELLFGLFPAIHSTRPDLVSTLKNQAGQPSGAKGAARFRLVLATSQIAVAMLLLASSGFFVKSLLNVSRVDLGFKIDHLVTFGLSPDLNGYSPDRAHVLYQRLEDDLRAAPGVTAVTLSNVPLLAGNNRSRDVSVQGFTAGPDTDSRSRYNKVGPGYFSALGIPLIAGREFTDADTATSAKVAIVNQTFARKFGLGSDAVGKSMGWAPGQGYRSKLDTTIVGVVEDAKYSEVKQQVPPQFFVPYRQDPGLAAMHVYVRTSSDTTQAASSIAAVVKQLDPNLPIEDLETLPQQVRNNTFLDRMLTTLSAAFALLATLLAAIGLYGVLAYTVAQRTREIGVRMALGAAPRRVRGMVLRQVAMMTLVGGLVGLAGALGVGKGAQSILFQMTGADPAVLALSAVLLALVTFCAGLIPAYRASRVDPMRALKYE
jgi:putative ABC transport system permease protein